MAGMIGERVVVGANAAVPRAGGLPVPA